MAVQRSCGQRLLSVPKRSRNESGLSTKLSTKMLGELGVLLHIENTVVGYSDRKEHNEVMTGLLRSFTQRWETKHCKAIEL